MTGRDLAASIAVDDPVEQALRWASFECRDGAPIDSHTLLRGLIRFDQVGEWDRVVLCVGDPDATSPSPDEIAEPAVETWNGSPLTQSVVRALRRAQHMGEDTDIPSVIPGTLALALGQDRLSGAGRALFDRSEIGVQETRELIQEAIHGTSGENLLRPGSGARQPPGPARPRQPSSRSGRHRTHTGGDESRVVSSAQRLARRDRAYRTADGTADTLAVVVAAGEDSSMDDFGELLEVMSLTPDDLREVADDVGEMTSEPAAAATERAALLHPDGGAGGVGLMIAALYGCSDRLGHVCRLLGINPAEAGAQLADADLSRRGDDSFPSMTRYGAFALFLRAVLIVAVLAASVIEASNNGGWWRLLWVLLLLNGHPAVGPASMAILAVPTAFILNPLVAVLQLAAIPVNSLQAMDERQVMWARTGTRLTLRELRRVRTRRGLGMAAHGAAARQRGRAAWYGWRHG